MPTSVGAAVAYDTGDEIVLKATGWIVEDGIDEKALRDAADYRTWADRGDLELCEGKIIDYERVADFIIEHASKDAGLKCVLMDTYGRSHLREALEKKGFNAVTSFEEKYGDEIVIVLSPTRIHGRIYGSRRRNGRTMKYTLQCRHRSETLKSWY